MLLRRNRLFQWVAPFAIAALLGGAAVADQAASKAGNRDEGPELSVDTVPEPAGYKMTDYRSPVPSTLEGGTVVDTAAAKALHDRGVAFIDVLPRPPKPKGLPEGTYWRPKPRNDIPGSIWLVDTGYGELAPVMKTYLLDGLDRAVEGDRSKPVVIYCDRDCWMSYNAAKRAIENGFTNVHWYPEGMQGWAEAGYPLERNEPRDRPDE
ncbi:PQQ-dependent catabolism-associated CXXCW motif protein [Fulvimarina sp. MAC3]|uniref:PQQ-dependent catabolism-associated CXXCW motif protein n=1 Tax=Fulvimarina sp. MAC3 TaxID=3148887 RepID=UPI0031FBADF1